jgi:DNA-directed RNA polymerase subunit K/omega
MLMRDDELLDEANVGADTAAEQPAQPLEPAPPITSRFLFVNVAGQRARQLRRGAAPRLDAEVLTNFESSKAERLAMEEVRSGLVYYDLPEWTPRQVEEVVVEPPRKRRPSRSRGSPAPMPERESESERTTRPKEQLIEHLE